MTEPRRLPRRDIVLLPLICLATLFLLLGVPEVIAEHAFYDHKGDACLRPDKTLGDRALPNCTARYKAAESPWVDYQYNQCGYRSKESCLTKPDGTFRVALLGSSTAMGYLVPYEQTFAVRTEKILSEGCGRPVEVQSMGGLGYQWGRLEARMDEALRLKPDLVVATITPFDMRVPLDLQEPKATPPQGLSQSVRALVQNWVHGSSLWVAVLHYRAELPVTYLNFFLRDTGRSDYLRTPLSPFWHQQIGYTETMVHDLAEKARAHDTKLLLVFVPMRSQAVLLKHIAEFPGLAPLELPNAVRQIADQNGVDFMDFTPSMAAAPDINPLWYALDDHLNGEGSALLAQDLSRKIIAAHLPGLQHCGPVQAATAAD